MTSAIKGMVLIINNFTETRPGSEKDVEQMKNMWLDLQFLPFCHNDLTTKKMVETMKVFSQKQRLKDVDCLAVVLMSHGNHKGIRGQCRTPLKYSEIFEIFNRINCPLMEGKPKLFFIQACRGEWNDGVPMDMDTVPDIAYKEEFTYSPDDEDTYIAYSTTYGFKAGRNPTNGSIFICAIDKVFRESADKRGIDELMVEVKDIVSSKIRTKDGKPTMQQPVVKGLLPKTLYLKEQIEM